MCLSAALDILLMHEFDLCFVFTAFLKQDNFWLYVLQVSWSNLADVIYDARVEQLIDICCFTQIKKQICGTSSSKILVMWQSEKNFWSFRIERCNFTQKNSFVRIVYIVFWLLPLFDNFVWSMTFYYFLLYNFVFPSFCTCLIPSAETWYLCGKQQSAATGQQIIMLRVFKICLRNSHLFCDN